jgi:hypothetical protein
MLITVWNLRQPKYAKLVDKKTSASLIPWGKDKKVKRYYYAFKKTELREVLALAGFKKIKPILAPNGHNHSFVCQ